MPGGGGGSGGSGSGSGSGSTEFAYVSATTSSSSYQIQGFSVANSGALTPISGSPFATQGYGPLSMAASDSMLFGSDGYSIDSFSIASDGAIKEVSSFKAGNLSSSSPPQPTGGPVDVFLDPSRSGSSLYDGFENLDGTENNGYQALTVNSSGTIGLIGNQGASPALGAPLAFSGDGQFAFTSSCYHGTPMISGFAVGSNGGLTGLSDANFSDLPAAPSGDSYCPIGAATDASNHLIVSVGVTQPEALQSSGPWQLATYTIDGSGNVTTTSTSSSMPTTSVGQPASYLLSPDNKYLAVGGQSGVQVFSYDSSTGTITALDGSSVLTGDAISQVAWDSGDHLFALAADVNSLYVYAVSSSGATAVSGSPYAVQGAYGLAVTQ
jgi:6-phosphogluconolactonase